MSFAVRFTTTAHEDLTRLLDFLVDRAEVPEQLDQAQAAIDAVRAAVQNQLAVTPYSFRKSGQGPTRRELIIPLGATGYVALCEIASLTLVLVLAVRHQREEDYH